MVKFSLDLVILEGVIKLKLFKREGVRFYISNGIGLGRGSSQDEWNQKIKKKPVAYLKWKI